MPEVLPNGAGIDCERGWEMGVNEGNFSPLKHGAKSPRHGLVLVALGNKYPGLAHDCRRWGRCLEALVREARGKVTPLDQERVCCAVRWELTARVAMRLAGETQDPGETLARLELASKATQRRSAMVEALKLDTPADPYAWLYEPQPAAEPSADSGVSPAPENATAATLGDVAGDSGDAPPGARDNVGGAKTEGGSRG